MKSLYWKLIPFVIFILMVLFLWRGLSLDPHHLPSVQVGKSIPEFSLQQLGNNKQNFTKASMRHEPVLLNIWASWCAACTEEQVFLMQLAQEGMLIYGINYKDSSTAALKWLSEWGNPYQIIGEDKDGRLAIDLGVYGAPETFLIDQNGVIQYRHTGPLTRKDWEKAFVPRLKRLREQS